MEPHGLVDAGDPHGVLVQVAGPGGGGYAISRRASGAANESAGESVAGRGRTIGQ